MRFFKVYEKLTLIMFLIFCVPSQEHIGLELTYTTFLGADLLWDVSAKLDPKLAQNELFLVL